MLWLDTFYYPKFQRIQIFNVIRHEASNTGFIILCNFSLILMLARYMKIKYLNFSVAILDFFCISSYISAPAQSILVYLQFVDVQNFIILARIQTCSKLYSLRFQKTSRNKMDLSFLFCQYKHTFYLDFWLCACAFSTLTTIFCSSIRKARLILKGKNHLVRTQHPQHRYWRTWAAASPVTHTLGAHGASVSSADVLLGLGEPHEDLRSNSSDLQERTRTMRPHQVACVQSDTNQEPAFYIYKRIKTTSTNTSNISKKLLQG